VKNDSIVNERCVNETSTVFACNFYRNPGLLRLFPLAANTQFIVIAFGGMWELTGKKLPERGGKREKKSGFRGESRRLI